MRFAGTLTVPAASFEACSSTRRAAFGRAAFRYIFFVGDHGGYQRSEEAVAQRLNREWAGSPARAHALTDYYRVTETQYRQALKCARLYRRRDRHARRRRRHVAGARDRSGLVRAAQTRLAAPSLDAAHGVYGDPRRASARAGALASTHPSRESVAAIRAPLACGVDDPFLVLSRKSQVNAKLPISLPALAAAVHRRDRCRARTPAAPPTSPRPAAPANAQAAARPGITTVPGMPPVVRPTDLYSETTASNMSTDARDALPASTCRTSGPTTST